LQKKEEEEKGEGEGEGEGGEGGSFLGYNLKTTDRFTNGY
jgi:hypothetical protein